MAAEVARQPLAAALRRGAERGDGCSRAGAGKLAFWRVLGL